MSRNSVTGTIWGRLGNPISPEAMRVSTHSWGTVRLASASGSEYAEFRAGAPAPAARMRAWFCLLVAH